jgi:hypothetical protein
MIAMVAPAADWHVTQAPVRFNVKLGSRPTHKQAGYFVQLPDGGILPKPFPRTHVISGNAEVKSYTLWQNAESGMGVVFEAPARGGDVLIYVLPARQLNTWTAASGLTPSAILCTQPGRGSRTDAVALSNLGAVSWNVHYRNRPGDGRAPMSLPGELTGWPGPCALYMLAHVMTTDPGKTWIAPITFGGSTEVRVDGKAIVPAKRNNKAGGTGQEINLSKGLHRLELMGWAGGSNTRNGLMTLTWRTPNTRANQLGGKRPADLPYPGTSMWEARPLQGGEIVRSGGASVTSCKSRDGLPVARIRLTPVENFWLGGEKPLFVYKVSAFTDGHPQNARYEWSFGDGATAMKPETYWLFPGGKSHRVRLTVSAEGKQSVATVPFFPFSTGKTDINRSECRENFRRGALGVLEAYPEGTDPTMGWDASYWNNLFRNMELDKGRSLLMHIFRVRWDTIEPKLSPQRRNQLVDIFLDFLPRIDPDMAIKWTETFEKRTRNTQEAAMMKVLRAEINLYYKSDPEAARAILHSILRSKGRDNASEWARIRAGDIEFLAGNLDDAVLFYGDVQDRAKKMTGAAGGAATKPVKRYSAPGLARSKAELNARRGATSKDSPETKGDRSFAVKSGGTVADWKKNAVADAAASETIRSLIEQGYLLEAKQALREWERRFPLSKVSSDFIIKEARFYMAVKDWTRAAAILDAYCDQVDASSFIPAAVKSLLECKCRLKVPKAELDEFCKKMKKKLEFHPVGLEIDQLRLIYGSE